MTVCLAAVGGMAAPAAPLVAEGSESPMPVPRGHWAFRLAAAERAVGLGLFALAERDYQSVLAEEGVPVAWRDEAILHLAALYISQQRLADAASWLDAYSRKSDAEWQLRQIFVLLHREHLAAARDLLDALNAEALPEEERPWALMARGLLDEAQGDAGGAREAFRQARDQAASPAQRVQFEYMLARTHLILGEVSEAVAAELEQKSKAYRGQPIGVAFAREHAVVLDKLGRKEEALGVIKEQLSWLSVEKRREADELLLLLALVAGPDTEQGATALQNLLLKGHDRELQQIALRLLASTAAEAEATLLRSFLDQLLGAADSHPLRDELLLLRATLFLQLGQLDAAQQDGETLLREFPASPGLVPALRLLASIAWRRQPPQYRIAADYLSRIRQSLTDRPERARLGALAADCYFLNRDFDSAARLYREVFQEAADPALSGPVLYQLTLASLQSGGLDAAREVLDTFGATRSVDALSRWRAEWNLLYAMRQKGEFEAAFRRIRQLLNASDPVPEDLRLRLLWLEASLSSEAGRPQETPPLVDALLRLLATLPAQALPSGQGDLIASHALLLKGQALILAGSDQEGLAVLAQLRSTYPGTETAIRSYIEEARYYASQGNTIEAQQRFIDMADRHPDSPLVPMALYEAAFNAEARANERSYREAISLLARLIEKYPGDALVYNARVKQADIARKLFDFAFAIAVYQDLLTQYPEHPERYRTELALADSLLAQAGQDEARTRQAMAAFERLFDLAGAPVDLRIEAGFKWAFSLARQGQSRRAESVYWQVATQFLLTAPAEGVTPGARGRYWLARALLELAALMEQEQRQEEASKVYALLVASELPGSSLARTRMERLGVRHAAPPRAPAP